MSKIINKAVECIKLFSKFSTITNISNSFSIFECYMESRKTQLISRMNEMGTRREPFVFLIDFNFENPLIFSMEDNNELLWKTPERSNFQSVEKAGKGMEWKTYPVSFETYQTSFDLVQKHIHNGDTYLLNLTMPTIVETNYSLEDIFQQSRSPYKIFLKNRFVCFSPEIFVRIENGTISSYPMKGTIDATIENAEQLLLNDRKETAEHNTIVDLIRNDLSLVASDVEVKKFKYIDRIRTNRSDLLQMSSQISGQLPANYPEHIGDILAKMLPAGSICGAPKRKTVEIIQQAEHYERGYYTGIFGIFDGKNLDSCVLIRYIEKSGDRMVFKSGGGITFMSDCQSEYNELIQKVYVPLG